MMLATKVPLKSKFLNFYFNCQLCANSKYFGILAYYHEKLKDCEREKVRKMLFESAVIFWKPLAILSLQEERQRAIDESVIALYKLETKINEIVEKFELNSSLEEIRAFQSCSPPLDFKFECRIKNKEILPIGYYLRSKQDFKPDEKILWSSDAFFGVMAYEKLGILTDEQLQQKALDCLKALKKHYNLLQKMFGIDNINTSLDYPNVRSEKIEQDRELPSTNALPFHKEVSMTAEEKECSTELVLDENILYDLGDKLLI